MGKLWIGISTHQHNLIGSAMDLDIQSDFSERERVPCGKGKRVGWEDFVGAVWHKSCIWE